MDKMERPVIYKQELVSTKDVSDILGITASAVSNLKSRGNNDFPLPAKETELGPLYDIRDIIQYGIQKNKLSANTISIPATVGEAKKIIIIGRVSTGKSFIVSVFAEDSVRYREIFSGNGSDTTACPVINNICKMDSPAFLKFETNFESLYGELENKVLLAKCRIANGMVVNFNDENAVQKVRELEELVREVHSVEGEIKSVTVFRVYSRPSKMVEEIFEQLNIQRLEIIDTPGVSSAVDYENSIDITKGDMYMFALKSDSKEETSEALRKPIRLIHPYISNAKVAFLYRVQDDIDSEEEYDELTDQAQEDMKAFDDVFDDLKDSIVKTDIDLLNPSRSCLLLPTMNRRKVKFTEEIFRKKLQHKVINSLKETNYLANISQLSNGQDSREFVKKIICNIPILEKKNEMQPYRVENFVNERHNRVKTGDNFRVYGDVKKGYYDRKKEIDSYFNTFDKENCPEEWAQELLQSIYMIIMNQLDHDCGLGHGYHPFEDYPALTMVAEESVIADKLYDCIKTGSMNSNAYIDIMKKANITSNSWDYVYIDPKNEMIKKLELISEYLTFFQVKSREQMIKVRYIEGLLILSKYQILESAGYSQTDIDAIFKSIYMGSD